MSNIQLYTNYKLCICQLVPCHTALVGALGITPIDFVLPLAMYIFLRKPKGWKLWLNWTLMVFYICIMIIGAVAAIRGIVLDACKSPLHSCCDQERWVTGGMC